MTAIAWGALAMLMHELGHLFAAWWTGAEIKAVTWRWCGPMIYPKVDPPNRYRATVNVAAGIAVNLLCGLLWRGTEFGFVSLFIGGFQILPWFRSDGSQLWAMWRNWDEFCRQAELRAARLMA